MENAISAVTSFLSFTYDPLSVVMAAGGLVLLFTFLTLSLRPQTDFSKLFFFLSIFAVTIAATGYIVWGTVALISASPAKGPVHWHADFRIFNCGEELDLIDPTGLSSRVGTPTVHEHGDKRVHIEGIPETSSIASLGNFFSAIGGFLDSNTLRLPTHDGVVEMRNGDMCREQEGVLQVFLWSTESGVATQKKLPSFADYIISPHALVPPGDCVIFEFDVPKERTEYICEQYTVAETRGDIVVE